MGVALVCLRRGHLFRYARRRGWFVCSRPGCYTIAYCPGCLGCRLTMLDRQVCEEHAGIDVEAYPWLNIVLTEYACEHELYEQLVEGS